VITMQWYSVALCLATSFILSHGESVVSRNDIPTRHLSWAVTAGHEDVGTPGSPKSHVEGTGEWHWEAPGTSSRQQKMTGQQPLDSGCRTIQFPFPKGTNGQGTQSESRASAVRQAYLDAWGQYATEAFGNDTLLPLSHCGIDDFYAWGLTIIEALDTALVMGLKEAADVQLAYIATIDFRQSNQLIVGFDTTIRYIAGLLGAYDLVTSASVPNASTYNETQVNMLLANAVTLADLIASQFNTPSGLPRFFVNTTTHLPVDGPAPFTNPLTNKTYTSVINTAIAGTNILEFHRLSDLTGNNTYRQLADKAVSNLINPRPQPVYPGLVGSMLDIETGEFLTYDAGWKSEIDSFLEVSGGKSDARCLPFACEMMFFGD